MSKRWLSLPTQAEPAAELGKALGISPLVAGLLLHRGLTDPQSAQEFLQPDLALLHPPSLLPNMDAGVDRLVAALQGGEPLLIFGDYDADGVTAVSLLVRLLKPLAKGGLRYYVPKRLEEGYGLNMEAIKRAAERGARLILTVDCGIGARAEVAAARELGVEMIVTDHHQPGENIPEGVPIIDPHLPGSRYPFPDLAGVGVAFKLAQALVERGLIPWDELRRHLDLVALGTVADVVPLLGENRVLAYHGLAQLNRTEHPGLRALLEITRLQGRAITAGHVGFVLAPRLNAMGRLGDASTGVQLLLTNSPDKGLEIAKLLEGENRERQRIEAQVLTEALSQIRSQVDLEQEKAIVLAAPGWHPGVIGIVASRLVENFHRPAVLIALDGGEGRGSGRSIPGFNLHQGLARCARHLERFGGHEAAAGLTIRSDKLGEFTREFTAVARAEIAEAMLEPTLKVEAEIALGEATLALSREIARLAPYGQANPAPVLACRGVRVVDRRTVGENNKHLKMRVTHGGVKRDAIGFNLGEFLPEVAAGGLADLAFTVEENSFNGATDVQLCLRDLNCRAQADTGQAAPA